jgi:hypothetical protein
MSLTHSSSCRLKRCRLCKLLKLLTSAHLVTKMIYERKMSIGCEMIYSCIMSTHPRDVLGKTLDELFIVWFQCSSHRFHVAVSKQQQQCVSGFNIYIMLLNN